MTVKPIIIVLATLLVLPACTTVESARWIGVGGSKADGNVVLGIDVPPKMWIRETEIKWDIDQANKEADRRCQNLGYTGSEMFREDFPVLVENLPDQLPVHRR